jgi:large subunit ribosomal protein L25
VEIECLPADIPSEFRADVSGLALNQALRAGDLPMDPEKIKLITDKDRVIAHVVTLKVEEEKPADAAAAGATPAEPEVIKKGKKDEEGEEGAEPAKGGEKAADKGDKKK